MHMVLLLLLDMVIITRIQPLPLWDMLLLDMVIITRNHPLPLDMLLLLLEEIPSRMKEGGEGEEGMIMMMMIMMKHIMEGYPMA